VDGMSVRYLSVNGNITHVHSFVLVRRRWKSTVFELNRARTSRFLIPRTICYLYASQLPLCWIYSFYGVVSRHLGSPSIAPLVWSSALKSQYPVNATSISIQRRRIQTVRTREHVRSEKTGNVGSFRQRCGADEGTRNASDDGFGAEGIDAERDIQGTRFNGGWQTGRRGDCRCRARSITEARSAYGGRVTGDCGDHACGETAENRGAIAGQDGSREGSEVEANEENSLVFRATLDQRRGIYGENILP
jgi:hypothetical protein